MRKSLNTATGYYNFGVRDKVLEGGSKASVGAVRSCLQLTSKLPWTVVRHIDDCTFVAEGKVAKDGALIKTSLITSNLLEKAPTDGLISGVCSGWIHCTSTGKLFPTATTNAGKGVLFASKAGKAGKAGKARNGAVEFITEAEEYDESVANKWEVEVNEYII